MEEQELTLEDWREMAMILQMALGHASARLIRHQPTPGQVDKLAFNFFKTALVTVSVMTQDEKTACIAQLIAIHHQRTKTT